MRIKQIRVRGFRPLFDVVVPMEELTTLIGPNGSGKSSVLAALRLFFTPTRALDERDFWRGTSSGAGAGDQAPEELIVDEVTVTVHFHELSGEAREAFVDYLDQDELIVERHFNGPGVGEYLAYRSAVPEFSAIRNQPKGHRDAYNDLVAQGKYAGLERAASKDDAFSRMAAWEAEHPEHCRRAPEAVNFVRESAASPTSIERYLRFFFVGALEDPAQHLDVEGRGAIGRLVQEVVDTEDLDERLEQIASEAHDQSSAVMASVRGAFDQFRESTGALMHRFAPGASIELRWEELSPAGAATPRVRVAIKTAQGPETDLEYQGHGLQRSLMYAVLTAQAGMSAPSAGRTIFLAIEEPEAFQHPLSSRVLGRTLRDLSVQGYQVVYTTHSPNFVQPDAVDGLRLVQRQDVDARGAIARVEAFDFVRFTDVFRDAVRKEEITETSLRARLAANLERRILEGLFAQACVLVEGDEDEALLLGAAQAKGVDLDERGIAVIQTRGKAPMPLALGFLIHAGVPCYPIFDLDRNKPEDDQHRWAEGSMLRLLNREELTSDADTVTPYFSCWAENLGRTVEGEMGDAYTEILVEVSHGLGYAVPQGRKVPTVLAEVLRQTHDTGLLSGSLDQLVGHVAVLTEMDS